MTKEEKIQVVLERMRTEMKKMWKAIAWELEQRDLTAQATAFKEHNPRLEQLRLSNINQALTEMASERDLDYMLDPDRSAASVLFEERPDIEARIIELATPGISQRIYESFKQPSP